MLYANARTHTHFFLDRKFCELKKKEQVRFWICGINAKIKLKTVGICTCRLPSPEKMRRMQTTQYPSLVETTCRRSLLDSIKIKVHIAFLFTSDPFIQRGFSIT